MADCDPERIMCLWNTHVKYNGIVLYSMVLKVLLITDSLGLNKICILKKTITKGA